MKYFLWTIALLVLLSKVLPSHEQYTFNQQPVNRTVQLSMAEPAQSQPKEPNTYTVVQVTDGDTLSIDFHWIVTPVRFIGLDTPEKWTKKTGFEECYGQEASAYAHKFFDGQRVRLEFDATQAHIDMYWRLLAHVYVGDKYYEQSAIESGYGFRLVFNNNPSIHDTELKLAEDSARQNNLGVWKTCWGKLVRKS